MGCFQSDSSAGHPSAEPIHWVSAFDTGHRQIDIEHQTMVALYNDVVNAATRSVSPQMCGRLLLSLETHVDRHLAYEEALMWRLQFAGAALHADKHRDDLDAIHMWGNEARSRQSVHMAAHRFMVWIMEHMRSDEHKLLESIISHNNR